MGIKLLKGRLFDISISGRSGRIETDRVNPTSGQDQKIIYAILPTVKSGQVVVSARRFVRADVRRGCSGHEKKRPSGR